MKLPGHLDLIVLLVIAFAGYALAGRLSRSVKVRAIFAGALTAAAVFIDADIFRHAEFVAGAVKSKESFTEYMSVGVIGCGVIAAIITYVCGRLLLRKQ